jgi:hypothetical protein
MGGVPGQIFGGGGVIATAGTGGFSPGGAGYGNTGAGGSGGVINQAPATTPQQPGGNGATGICWVTEYCWLDGGAQDCFNVNARVAIGARQIGFDD